MRVYLFLAAVLIAGCTVADTASPPETNAPAEANAQPDGTSSAEPDAPASLTADGWGPLRIGMTRQEVVTASGEDANPEAVGGPDPDSCDEFRPSRAPEGMLVMIEQGRLSRISLSEGSDVRTDEGFAVGDSAATIKAAYGSEAAATPHKYSPAPAEYITVWQGGASGPDARGMVYEVGTDGRVSHIHAGGPSIKYVEGCL
jgi:hypothetical protein